MTIDEAATIDESVIEALRSRTRRYDVSIEEDFVISVLPNGVKTWTWVHDDPSDPHRKTLGIFPEMSLEEARKSLAIEKEAYQRGAGKTPEFVIRDGRIQSASTTPSRLPVIAAAIVAVIASIVIVYLLTSTDSQELASEIVEETSPFAETPSDVALQLPTVAQEPEPADAIDNRSSTLAPGPARPDSDTVDASGTSRPSPTTASATTGNAPIESELPVRQTDDNPQSDGPAVVDATPRVIGPMLKDLTLPNEPDSGATPSSTQTPDTHGKQTDRPAQAVPAPVETSLAENPPGQPERQEPVGQSTEPDAFGSSIVGDDRVARAQLTSAINSREPVDDLGIELIGTGADLQTYYFFTELRSLSGQQVRHRWVRQDEIIAEVPFNVGEAWRWRVYSSKSFIPAMAGQWQVQVVLEDDTVIHSIPFVFIP